MRAPRDTGRAGTLYRPRQALPTVPDAPPPALPGTSLGALWEAWKTVTVTKPRTVTETRYILDQLAAFLGHSDAASITREDIRRWRDASKADGKTNNTWNNRLSLVRQVFAQAVSDGRLRENPADNSLRLRKSKVAVRLPYSDDDAARARARGGSVCLDSVPGSIGGASAGFRLRRSAAAQ
jgi:hypothetical protein